MLKAQYTVHLKTLLEDENTKSAIDKALSTYPLYEKKTTGEYIDTYIPTREELNKKILNYYKYREIGFPTPGRFIEELEVTMNEIMPYYNQLMMTIDQDYNFLYNVDYTKEYDITKNGSSETLGTSKLNETSNSESSSETSETTSTEANTQADNKNVNVDTPQGIIDVPGSSIDDVDHATSVTFNSSTGHDTGSSTGSGETSTSSEGSSETTGTSSQNVTSEDIEKHLERTKGNYGMVTFQSLIEKYRDLILNIEQEIIKDRRLSELFMRVW